jgi:hypothetical protein
MQAVSGLRSDSPLIVVAVECPKFGWFERLSRILNASKGVHICASSVATSLGQVVWPGRVERTTCISLIPPALLERNFLCRKVGTWNGALQRTVQT